MMGQERDSGRNQKVSGNKWKWTHNSPKLMEQNKGSPDRELIAIQNYLKKIETFQINNLTLHRSTQIYKENLGEIQERYWQQHTYSRGF